jgi:hypothetical protein
MLSTDRTIPSELKLEEKYRRYHQILKTILASHVAVQQQYDIHSVTVELGAFCKGNVNIKVPVHMILGDMQGGDKHCGSKMPSM